MKLLLDENLSRRLLEAIQDLFPGSVHVTQVGLGTSTMDRKIWDYALQNSFVILTADTDFVTLAECSRSASKSYPARKLRLSNRCCWPDDSCK